MISLLFLLNLACPDTEIINLTKTWNKIDKSTLERCKTRCSELYPKSNPCLTKFKKVDEGTYFALCGPKKP